MDASEGGKSMTRKKKTSNTPRRKRMNRKSRLQSATKWLDTYQGNNIVRGYSRRYGINMLTAAIELKMLGKDITSEYLDQLKAAELAKQKATEARKKVLAEQKAKEKVLTSWPDSWLGDDTYYYMGEVSFNPRDFFEDPDLEDEDIPF